MSSINKLLSSARTRFALSRSLSGLVVGASGAALALGAVRLGEGWFGPLVDWSLVLMVGGAGAAIGAVVWGWITAERGEALARRVDENARLKETLSSALAMGEPDDPWGRAVLEDAQRRAAGVDSRVAAPIAAPRWWGVPLVLIMGLGVMLLFDPPDLRSMFTGASRVAPPESEARAIAVKAEADEAQAEIKKILERSNLDIELPKSSTEAPEARLTDPDSVRRAALRELTSVRDQLEQMRSGENAQRLEQMKEKLRKLRQPGPGPAQELARALARGEFQKAQEELSQLAKQMRQSELSPEQKEQLESQLENLAEQLNELAQDRKALEQALKRAGVDPSDVERLARDPSALEQTLQNMPNLSPQQMQSLMNQAKASQQACEACQNMGDSAQQMSQSMQGNQNNAMNAMDQLSDQLSEMEMMDQEMQAINSAMNAAQQQMSKLGQQPGDSQGQGMWSRGDSDRRGQGSGGPGQGEGRGPEARETSASFKKQRSPVSTGQGPIIASRLVYEGQIRGESARAFSTAAKAGAEEATEAIESMRVPREYHALVKQYFGSLEDEAEGVSGGGEGSADGDD